jgi:hypothetical protein
VTDVSTFSDLYWREQASTATLLVVLACTGALAGAALYGFTDRRRVATTSASGA